MSKVQAPGTLLRIRFALLKCPHLHSAYLVTVRFDLILAVHHHLFWASFNNVESLLANISTTVVLL